MKGNKTALVTGCSSGIGYTTCLLLARNNFKTYGSVRDLSKAQKIQEVIDKEKLPLKIIRWQETNIRIDLKSDL